MSCRIMASHLIIQKQTALYVMESRAVIIQNLNIITAYDQSRLKTPMFRHSKVLSQQPPTLRMEAQVMVDRVRFHS